jgi:voltage-gated potassium channel
VLVIIRIVFYFIEVDLIKSTNSLQSPGIFLWSERFIALIFTIEYFVRWYNSRNPRKYPRKPMAIIDFLSFIFFWVGFFVPIEWLGTIRALRIFSALKLFRYNVGFQLLLKEIGKLIPVIRPVFWFSFMICLLFGSMMYEFEKLAQPEKYTGIFDGIWWACVTISTVGYGDLFPITTSGRIIGMILMFIGCGIMGAYIGLFGLACTRAFKKLMEETESTKKEETKT